LSDFYIADLPGILSHKFKKEPDGAVTEKIEGGGTGFGFADDKIEKQTTN